MTTPKMFFVITAIVTLAPFACEEAQATPIVGLLNISGSAPASIGESVSPAWFDVAVGDAANTGAFSGILIDTRVAIASPFVFLRPSSLIPIMWSLDGVTLDLTPTRLTSQTDQTTINGIARIFSFESNPPFDAKWTLTIQNSGEFNFQLTSGTLVTPDGGTTILLLGLGLVAIAGCRAKFVKS